MPVLIWFHYQLPVSETHYKKNLWPAISSSDSYFSLDKFSVAFLCLLNFHKIFHLFISCSYFFFPIMLAEQQVLFWPYLSRIVLLLNFWLYVIIWIFCIYYHSYHNNNFLEISSIDAIVLTYMYVLYAICCLDITFTL